MSRRMRRMAMAAVIAAAMTGGGLLSAAEHRPAEQPGAAHAGAGHEAAGLTHESDAPGPAVSADGSWAPKVLAAIAGLFAAAAFVGPIYRWYMPEEPQVEDFHSHDEPPGTSHHHGASGTVDHSAPDAPPGHH